MINNKKIIIGSRKSNLAKAQVSLVIAQLKKAGIEDVEIKYLESKGDKLKASSFKKLGGKGLFTKDIDLLTSKGIIDLGVHSAKDITAFLDPKLDIGACLSRENPRDVLITKKKNIKNIDNLPVNSLLGTSSPRRASYILNYRPDIKIIPIRGNIETRIKKVITGEIFSLIIAKASINRLKYQNASLDINTIPLYKFLPAPGQGIIALVYKKTNSHIKKIIDLINCENTLLSLITERSLIKKINGDCFTPIAAMAKIKNNKISLKSKLFSNDGRLFSSFSIEGKISDAKEIGKISGKELLKSLKLKIKNEKDSSF